MLLTNGDSEEVKWDVMSDALRDMGHRQQALKFWPAAVARGAQVSDLRGRARSIVRLNPHSACQLADKRRDVSGIRRIGPITSGSIS